MSYSSASKELLSDWDGKECPPSRVSTPRIWQMILINALVFSTGLLAGRFTLGQCSLRTESSLDGLNLQTSNIVFQYNRSFSYPPSNYTDTAWRDMFPDAGGFFSHPQIAPTKSTFSVFHQLHCVDVLRQGYFKNHEAAAQGVKLHDDDIEEHIRPPHIRHCIDLLRQSLRCHADTTIEEWDPVKHGVIGFGTEHECRSWDQLVSWVAEQQQLYPYE